jgi:heme-degrading monooxygenase HmoA
MVTGECTRDDEHYYVTFSRWVSENDWLGHLRGKTWFDEDDFRAAVGRVHDPRIRSALLRQRGSRHGQT